ncbi:hypothetical protein [Nocardiopsis sp. NPDC006938]|uniref:hypothetical protein n=1 Tax=Nocardiopsis sp. NPDC006938 TaxID=3364337 RepID=UPI0036A722DB
MRTDIDWESLYRQGRSPLIRSIGIGTGKSTTAREYLVRVIERRQLAVVAHLAEFDQHGNRYRRAICAPRT